jgi:tetratricopeptide (TPR) repeat protein
MADTANAITHYKKAIAIREQNEDSRGTVMSLANLASLYIAQCKFEEAKKLLDKSLNLHRAFPDKLALAYLYQTYAQLYIDTKNHVKAIEYGQKELAIGRENSYPDIILNAAMVLKTAYKRNGNFAKALEFSELHTQTRDSIESTRNKKAAIKSHLKYDFEKKAAADSVVHAKATEVKNAELARHQAEIKAKKNQQYALFGGLGLVMVFAGFMYNRFKVTQKQKLIIESQKDIVEEQKKIVDEKQKEILDSIHYAKRIQKALLPSEKYISRVLLKK